MKPIPELKGNTLTGVLDQMAEDTPRFLAQLANSHDEIVRFRIFGNTFYLLTSPELVREVLVTRVAAFPKDDRDISLLSRIIGKGLVTTNGDEHRRQRALTQPAFHHRRIEAYARTMVDYTEEMLDGFTDGQTRDIAHDMMNLTMFIVTKSLFGAGKDTMAAEAERVGEAIHMLQEIADAEFVGPFVLPEWLPTRTNRDRKQYRAVVHGVIDRMVTERRAAGAITDTGDLLSMLLLARDEDGAPMSDREVRDQLLTLFVAGHETTSNALTWTWYLLSEHPAAAARLHEEVDRVLGDRPPTLDDLPNLPYTLQVLKESMRLYPPAWVLNIRRAAAATVIGDYTVPKGALIWLSPYAMHHQARFFPEPERFAPERWTPDAEKALPRYAYMPFGAGPRVCIGNGFAMMEAHLIVAAMARRVSLALAPDQTIEKAARVTLSNRTGMRMRVAAR